MTVLSNIITPSNVLTTTNTATVTNKTLTSPTVTGMTVSDGTASGVTYLNGSKVLTSGSALTYSATSGLTTNGVTQGYNTTLYTVDGTLSNYSAANNVYLNGNTAGGLNLRGDGTGGASTQLFLGGATSSEANKIIFTVASSEGMRLTSTGLGIGTSSPANVLNVKSATQYKGVQVNNATNTIAELIGFDASNESGGLKLYSATSPKVQFLSNGDSFLTGGNFGIGTLTPATKLAVAGGMAGTGGLNISGSGWGVLPYVANSLVVDSVSGETRLFATGTDASTHGKYLFYTGTTNGTASERARIDASGNLLVGTTSFTSSTSVSNGIFGGNFRSIRSNATIPANSTASVITLSSSVTGVYIVNANFGAQSNNIYGGMLIVVANSGSFRIVTNGGGSSSALSMSGANVQITNSLGSPLDAVASAIFIGN
jgi:hypothetical protein